MAEFELRAGRKSFGLGTGDGNFGLRDSDDALRRKVREAVERRELEKTAKMVGHQGALKDKAELARAQERRVEKERQLLAGVTREQADHQKQQRLGCPTLDGLPQRQKLHQRDLDRAKLQRQTDRER